MTLDKKTLIKTAYLHFRDAQWNEAIKQYQKLLELDPSDILALNMLGDIHAREGRVTEALQYYRQAVKIFAQQGARDKVEIVRRKMSKLDPNSVEEEAPAAAEPAPKAESSAMDGAIHDLETKLATDPKNLENYQKLAETLVKAGRANDAIEHYLTVANALFNNRLYKKATPVYQQIVQIDAGNLAAHTGLGEIYAKDGLDSEAKKEFLFVAENLIRQGNLEKGQIYAQKAIELKSIEAHYYLGLVYYQKNQLQEARAEFEVLLKFKVNHQGALTHLAQIFANMNQLDDAFGLYERLLKADSKNADALEKMAEIDLRQNRTAQACEKFVQAMEAFAAEEQWERATTCASQAVKLDPQKPELYLKLADAAYNAGLEHEAGAACAALGDLYASQGKTDEAAKIRAKARELLGEGGPAQPQEEAKPAAAAPQPSRVEQPLTPENEAKVMMNIAATHIRQGALDEAIEIYLKVLKKDPNNEEVKTALTRAYAMFAGVNPETAVARKSSAAKSASAKSEDDEQRIQREARERAQREAQVRAQRTPAAPAPVSEAPTKPIKEDELLQTSGSRHEDEIAGDSADEFMTITVAEIYTKQGLLNEALKIYQKILEIEPGNGEAQGKKHELESTLAEQERLRQRSEEAEHTKKSKTDGAKETKKSVAEPEKPKPGKNDDEPPAPGRRGRVSYV